MDTAYVKRRHRFYFSLLRPTAWLIAFKYHFKTKPLRLKKGEQYLILSNHQGLLDPVFVGLSFKAPVYFVATDSIFTTKWYSRLLVHCLAPVRKRKGALDYACIKTMFQIAKEGGNIALFPEGNRSWCDFQFPIDDALCKLVRKLKLPVILYNIKGGYGVDPRWARSIRKGSHTGEVGRILTLEEIGNMTDEELQTEIVSGLKVIDSESGQLYRSKTRAENLEHLLFVCPKCGGFSTIRSAGTRVFCTQCGLEAEYTEDLHLVSSDEQFRFRKLSDWYKFQLEAVKNYTFESDTPIFADDNVVLYDKTTQERLQIAEGALVMTRNHLKIGESELALSDIVSASPVGGAKLGVNTKEKSYFFIGDDHFNPVKYLLFFNILCEQIAKRGGDPAYGLSIDDKYC